MYREDLFNSSKNVILGVVTMNASIPSMHILGIEVE